MSENGGSILETDRQKHTHMPATTDALPSISWLARQMANAKITQGHKRETSTSFPHPPELASGFVPLPKDRRSQPLQRYQEELAYPGLAIPLIGRYLTPHDTSGQGLDSGGCSFAPEGGRGARRRRGTCGLRTAWCGRVSTRGYHLQPFWGGTKRNSRTLIQEASLTARLPEHTAHRPSQTAFHHQCYYYALKCPSLFSLTGVPGKKVMGYTLC